MEKTAGERFWGRERKYEVGDVYQPGIMKLTRQLKGNNMFTIMINKGGQIKQQIKSHLTEQ